VSVASNIWQSIKDSVVKGLLPVGMTATWLKRRTGAHAGRGLEVSNSAGHIADPAKLKVDALISDRQASKERAVGGSLEPEIFKIEGCQAEWHTTSHDNPLKTLAGIMFSEIRNLSLKIAN
jgi:hypothetical protein